MNIFDYDMEQQCRCVICGDAPVADLCAAKLLSLPPPLTILRCERCELRWLNPRPTRSAYRTIYRDLYYSEELPEDYAALVAQRRTLYAERLGRIVALSGAGVSLIDVGAAKGDFVAMAREWQLAAEGLEPSQWGRDEAMHHYGLSLMPGDISGLPTGSYDIVHMNHVFEHLLDPLEQLAQVRRILRAGGYFVMEVPQQFTNIVEMRHRLLGKDNSRSFSLYSVHHPFFYTAKSLRRILEMSGFRVTTLSTWNSRISRGSTREKILLLLGDLFGKRGDFIEVFASKEDGSCAE